MWNGKTEELEITSGFWINKSKTNWWHLTVDILHKIQSYWNQTGLMRDVLHTKGYRSSLASKRSKTKDMFTLDNKESDPLSNESKRNGGKWCEIAKLKSWKFIVGYGFADQKSTGGIWRQRRFA